MIALVFFHITVLSLSFFPVLFPGSFATRYVSPQPFAPFPVERVASRLGRFSCHLPLTPRYTHTIPRNIYRVVG
ncbi:hypothetical protein PLICRDRAFT_38043 [Plicaturopsis crispa FD-325 SS-3]|nr:hypothetical protein PLICRDRAFT_38043 [Plicaturopsis crispa FD-325 SS-3]